MQLPYDHPAIAVIRAEVERLAKAEYSREDYYQGQLQAYRNVLATLDPLTGRGESRDDNGAGIALVGLRYPR